MQLFRKHIRPAWIFRSGKKVWRLLPGHGVLAVELRDTEKKETEFAALNIFTGSPYWHNLQFDEKWWITVNKVHRGVLLLQQFVKPDMPTPGRIFAVDALTGRLLWQNDELKYVNAVDNVVYGLRSTLTSEEVVGLDCRTGESSVTIPADDTRLQEISGTSDELNYLLPVSFDELDEKSASVSGEVIPPGAKAPSVIKTESGWQVLGFHIAGGTDEKGVPLYESHLKVMDNNGHLQFQDVTDRGLYTTLLDFYFIVSGMLLFVRNSNEIVAVRLS